MNERILKQFILTIFFILLSGVAFPQIKIGRWKVKTISDADTVKINFDSVVVSTVHDQLMIPIERHLTNKRSSSETTVYSIPCRLIAFRRTRDFDIHMIIQDTVTKETMVAEIPDPVCVSAKSSCRFVVLEEMRKSFIALFGKPGKYFQYLNPPEDIIITGIGFFDICHGQKGMAHNCREIHPVLSLKKIN